MNKKIQKLHLGSCLQFFTAFSQHVLGSARGSWESDRGAWGAWGINFLVSVTVLFLFLQISTMYILDCGGVPYISGHLLILKWPVALFSVYTQKFSVPQFLVGWSHA